MAGFEVRYAVEKDKSAAMTYRHNHPNTLVLLPKNRKDYGYKRVCTRVH